MRRIAMTRGGMLASAVVIAAAGVLAVSGCRHRNPKELADCSGTPGGLMPITGTPHQKDLPSRWGPSAHAFPLGANKVRLVITPVQSVSDFALDCLSNGSYVVAMIQYADPNSPTPVAELPGWTDHKQAVYVLVKKIAGTPVAPNEFDYAILVPRGTDALDESDSNPRHGFWFSDPNPSAGKDHAQWGVPSEHINYQPYEDEYRKVSGGDVPAPPTDDGAEIHKSADSDRDPAQAAWFSCSQGCCTATAIL